MEQKEPKKSKHLSVVDQVQSVYPIVTECPLNPDEEITVLHGLRVIASVKEKQRVFTSNGVVSVYPADERLLSVRRMLSGQSRYHNLDDIDGIVTSAFEFVEYLLARIESQASSNSSSRADLISRMSDQQKIDRFKSAIESVHANVANLIETYREDHGTVARIELLRDIIQDRLDQMKVSIEYLRDKLNVQWMSADSSN